MTPTETLTESLRRRLRASVEMCPTCHQPTGHGGVREMAERVGVQHTTLWRFLRGDNPSSATLDAVAAFLDSQEAS